MSQQLSRRQQKDQPKPCVLVTGAGGALARQVIKRLWPGFDVVAVDFKRRGFSHPEIPTYHVEYSKRAFEDIFRKHKIDAIVHLGRMGLYEFDHRRRYAANVLGTQKLLELAKKYEVKQVIALSTYFVYGASPYNPALLTEDAPLKASELTMDLVDSVELENLATIYLWKYPELNVTILRPCNIVGPGVMNSISLLLGSKTAPVVMGFSPMMQFLHVEDMADAVSLALIKNKPGIYNVAPSDWVPYPSALESCGCKKINLPSMPSKLTKYLVKRMNLKAFPSYLLNYYKYPVILDGRAFADTFGFTPKHSVNEIFSYYKEQKQQFRELV
ncbi:MAG: SDR family oxidoreductase [Pseudomonadota bacterium]|nr:SDR family oxidoreductase [Pseudomonadota bacterium]